MAFDLLGSFEFPDCIVLVVFMVVASYNYLVWFVVDVRADKSGVERYLRSGMT